MAKGYWITFYRAVTNASALAEYAKLAGPAIEAGGGKISRTRRAGEGLRSGAKRAYRAHRVRERDASDRDL